MKKIYYLSTCDTCKRIIKELGLKEKGFEFQDIKTQNITAKQLEELKEKTGSHEALFSKQARKFQLLKNKNLSEADIKQLIVEEYTFLKRPVVVLGKKVFVGNKPETVEALRVELG